MLFAADFRRNAREALNGKWGLAIGTGLVAMLLGADSSGSGGGGGSSSSSGTESFGGTGGIGDAFSPLFSNSFARFFLAVMVGMAAIIIVWAIVTFIIGGAVELGYCRFNKNLITGNNARFNDIFSRFDLFGKALGLRVVTTIFIVLWTFLFIIPGIIAAYRYSMAFYIMDDNPEIGIMEAINRSKEMMDGNKWRLFCLQFSFIGWAILCVLTMGIGFLWYTPYYNAAIAAFYLEVSGQGAYGQQQDYEYYAN